MNGGNQKWDTASLKRLLLDNFFGIEHNKELTDFSPALAYK